MIIIKKYFFCRKCNKKLKYKSKLGLCRECEIKELHKNKYIKTINDFF